MITPIENWLTLDENGVQMPWYTRPCLEWLQTVNLKRKKIFEYGAGYSTLWYESKGATVWGVDHDLNWRMNDKIDIPPTQENYLLSITTRGIKKFDIVSIDGIYRDQCIQYALKRVKKGGYIIIDNYKQATADLVNWPITEKLIENLEVHCYKEPTHKDWQTIVIHV